MAVQIAIKLATAFRTRPKLCFQFNLYEGLGYNRVSNVGCNCVYTYRERERVYRETMSGNCVWLRG